MPALLLVNDEGGITSSTRSSPASIPPPRHSQHRSRPTASSCPPRQRNGAGRPSRQGAPTRRRVIRVRPVGRCRRRPRAASRPRRPDTAQTKQQRWGTEFVPTTWVNRRCGGRVLGETQHRDVEGMSARIRSRRTRPANAARTNFSERPRNPAVQGGFKAHVRSRAKCMPVAPQRGHPPRAKRPPSL